jgi:nicotinate phosphoribosyltransferase
MGFFIAKEEDIKRGKTTDVYFKRTEEILKAKGLQRSVVAEFTASRLPKSYKWGIFAGVEEVVNLLKDIEIDLFSLPEGTLFRARDIRGIPIPVMYIEGDYTRFAVYETPILGFICQTSGIATRAARVRIRAGDSLVLSFGVRRMHPAISPMIDRAAFLGGCDGVSSILAAEMIGEVPRGTMPHSLIIIMGQDEAWRAFDEIVSPEVPRIALIDTYGDEKTEAVKAAEIIKKLVAVRLDTPSSRRGNFADIVREVRWELDIRGFKEVSIFVSGGLDEDTIPELKEAGATGFGVGTSIANAPTIDFAMDIVEVEGKPAAKKGKFGGKKKVMRCKECLNFLVLMNNEEAKKCPLCGNDMESVLIPLIKGGKLVKPLPDIHEIRREVLKQLELIKKRGEF